MQNIYLCDILYRSNTVIGVDKRIYYLSFFRELTVGVSWCESLVFPLFEPKGMPFIAYNEWSIRQFGWQHGVIRPILTG